jgi:hypothetical protein
MSGAPERQLALGAHIFSSIIPTSLVCRIVKTSVVEPHHFYAAPAPGENFDAAPAPAAPAPTLLHTKAKF